MIKLKSVVIIAAFLQTTSLMGQDNILPYNPEDSKTYISTAYFGPNAFPVPDMPKNTTGRLEMRVNATGSFGTLGDRTVSADFSVRVPLWSERVNVCVWGQKHEWYWETEEVRRIRRVAESEPLTGHVDGDFYFSVDMKVLTETKARPRVVLRAACKTASGGQYPRARYYDCPGYFFDVCAAKDFEVGKEVSLTAALTAGFLCWQVDNGRQNDAVMYGAALGVRSPYVDFAVGYGGYTGWKDEGDRPMTLKLTVEILPSKMVLPYLQYEHGVRDWPFDQFKAGVRVSLDIFKTTTRTS